MFGGSLCHKIKINGNVRPCSHLPFVEVQAYVTDRLCPIVQCGKVSFAEIERLIFPFAKIMVLIMHSFRCDVHVT